MVSNPTLTALNASISTPVLPKVSVVNQSLIFLKGPSRLLSLMLVERIVYKIKRCVGLDLDKNYPWYLLWVNNYKYICLAATTVINNA